MRTFFSRDAKKAMKDILYFIKKTPNILFPKKNEKTILVIGMHRSGTSMTSGVLRMMGVNIGHILLGPTEHNKKGHFENYFFEKLNKSILKEAGGSWHDPPDKQRLFEATIRKGFQIQTLIRAEQDRLWGWKDPTTVLILEGYLPYLRNLYLILCKRDKEDIIRSLIKRDHFNYEKARALTDYYTKEINMLKDRYDIPTLEVDFKEFLFNPKDVIDDISEFIQVNVNERQFEEINRFIDPDLSAVEREN
jgi:hypothetical protein